MRTWIIGSDGDCDVVVAQPRVSRRHCRLTELVDGFLLEDLGSSNGTYVNGNRIEATERVSAEDRVTLGALVALPWPPDSGAPGATIVRIGRAPDNEIVLDDHRVSSHHARLLVRPGRTLIEDVGSSNGTFLNSPDQRVTQSTPLSDLDTVYFGSMAVPAARLLPATAPVPPMPAEGSPAPAPVRAPEAWRSPWTMAVLAQAPAIAILIVLSLAWPGGSEGIASSAFATAAAAVWLGGSLAGWAFLIGRVTMPRMLGWLGAAAVIQCAVMLTIVRIGGGLRGPWMAEHGVLTLASAIGLALGWLAFSTVRKPVVAAAALLVAFAAMTAMGGRIWRLPDSRPLAVIAVAMPTRWAFEGLLLLEDERPVNPGAPGPDLVEDYFPVERHRMGPKADAMALGFMLIGLAGASAFVTTRPKAAT